MSESETRSERPLMASVENLRQELDRWLEVAWTQGEKALDAFGIRPAGGTWSPRFDLIETPDDVRVVVDLPGIDPASVEITLAGNMLTVQGEKPKIAVEEGQVVHTRQWTTGPFSCSIPMPAPLNPEEVSAVAKHGVLHIRIAKSERAKTRQIQVHVEDTDTD